jgi:ribonuclease R
MKLASYSPDNVGHYGLAKAEYTHFTSPIRRYPDLIVHRILKHVFHGLQPGRLPLQTVGLHTSEQERKADEAERDLVEWRIFRFLKDKLGEEFSGVVVDINRSGLLVELNDYFVQGLLAFDDLGKDDYRPRTRSVVSGKRTGEKFELGQTLRVMVASVNPVLRRMTLVPAKNRRD